ncbi:hypothetical protein Aph01nite_34460 [Acrocarpospora phusangensis]|uniref:Uncharacterized protein n=1 Tax=Acrocarpospora phusangensis TaxID=1070424 RepID=A0A919QAB6_9ACTN|nr:hypothetical protein [Acrocarpospora phusangensis]GIH25136.1 hypothetical protein Aph01nite_34460 [Acrocarpospora phusangensis]
MDPSKNLDSSRRTTPEAASTDAGEGGNPSRTPADKAMKRWLAFQALTSAGRFIQDIVMEFVG